MTVPQSAPTSSLRYRRILLKISGEGLQGRREYGISMETLTQVSKEIAEISRLGAEVAIVIGGGNIFRGVAATTEGMDRATADYMGMLATIINAMALQDALERAGVPTRVLSALDIKQVAEPYIRRRAIRHLEKGRAVIFAAGTGNPYFTTDTAAALRAMEIQADVVIKGTSVNGVYDADPKRNPDAKMIPRLSYIDVLNKGLKVMDATAISLCMDHNLPILVLNLFAPGTVLRALQGEALGTVVGPARQER